MSPQPPPPPLTQRITRRTWLRRVFAWSAAAATAIIGYPLLRYTQFKVKPKPRYVSVDAPLPLSGYYAERDFILFAAHDTAQAVSRTCTHLGCRVNFLEDKDFIECPCHQSRFSRQGQRLSGPAERNLPTYAVEIKRDINGEVTKYVVELI